MTPTLRSSLAEFLGTTVLVTAVIGSGLMAERLSEDRGVMLVMNVSSTVLVLALLIAFFLPISGAHFNPVVTLVSVIRRESSPSVLLAYLPVQLAGGITGATLSHLMFDEPLLQLSSQDRSSLGTVVGEIVATAGLVLVINVSVARGTTHLVSIMVPAWIAGASLFTSSASFANPAVTLGRAFSDSFTGIAPSSVLPYVGAQVVGALLGLVLSRVLTSTPLVSPSRANSHSEKASTP